MSKRVTAEEFLARARAKHGDRYEYDLGTFSKMGAKVKVICKEHGEWLQQAWAHVKGQGCPGCKGGAIRKAKAEGVESFVVRATAQWGSDMNYSEVEYVNARTPVKITCAKGHTSWQQPFIHLKSKHGCPNCATQAGAETLRMSFEDFVQRSSQVHGGKYAYAPDKYTRAAGRIDVCCPQHGWWESGCIDHLYEGCGCPRCTHRVSKPETEWLDSLGVLDRQVNLPCAEGLCNVDGFDPATNTVYEFHGDFWHGHPERYPRGKINTVVGLTMGELYDRTIAKERRIRDAGYNLIVMWESEWNEVKRAAV